ncbi:S1 family peptidase [Amycolatopsis anabasis]|uniref:S1 family peptidase n=1 Tax=Amycolatopsis anabasis TaxID=1840409 RepID=UPI001FE7BD11|nr:serine protease [Amycolatopsis anabasis]
MKRKTLLLGAAMAAVTTVAAGVTALAADGSPAQVQPYIIGGHPAAAAPPGITSLQYDAASHGEKYIDYHTCGGALVFRGWVVTAAHCVTDPPAGSPVAHQVFGWTAPPIPTADKKFKVRVGGTNRTQGGETAWVTKIVVHPDWNWAQDPPKKPGAPEKRPVSDIAMLKLDHLLQQPTVQLARTPARPGDKISLYGWGETEPDSNSTTLPIQLQQLDTSVTAPSRCAESSMSAGEICTDNPSGTDGSCYGDSGGPAYKNINGVLQLVGGASRNADQQCGLSPNVYTSQPDFREFIYQVARTGSA